MARTAPLVSLLIVLLSGFVRKAPAPGLVLGGFLVVVTPWAVRNTRLQGVVTIVDTMGGMNLRMGNYEHTPEDRMWDAVSLTGDRNWIHGFTVTSRPGRDRGTQGQVGAADGDRVHAVAPRHDVPSRADQVRRFLGPRARAGGRRPAGTVRPAALDRRARRRGHPRVLCRDRLAGGAAFWLTPPEWRVHVLMLLPIVVITGVHTIVFGHSRYHIPLVPILALYGMALVAIRRSIEWPQQRSALAGAAATILIFVVIWVRQIITVDAGHIRAILQASS